MDHYLQPLVMGTPSFLKDTKHVINILDTVEWKPTYLSVTADVASLYTAIKLEYEGRQHFLLRDSTISITQSNFILGLLDFSMTHNYFWHDRAYYLQIKGVDTGAKFAPSIPNLFMSKWEEDTVLHNGR